METKMNTPTSFIEELLKVTPELKEVYDEHLADNDGLLPHVFMGDVTRYVVAETANQCQSNSFQHLLDQMEVGLNSNAEDVRELVAVSFVENLCGEDETLAKINPLIGPTLKKEIVSICGSS